MPKTNPKPKPEPQGFGETALLPFLKTHSLPLALLLIAIAVARIVATYPVMFLTTDEPVHFACGLEYVAMHDTRCGPEHPPLARAMAGLLPYLAGARPAGEPVASREAEVVAVRTGNPNRILTLMRTGILPFFVLASLVVYFWSRHHFGGAVAVIATGFFTWLPAVLAHAGLATTDMALTAFLGAAFYALILWLESPTSRHTLLLSLFTALAVLSKFTALLFLPFCALALVVQASCPVLFRVRARKLAVAVLAGALILWSGYCFSFGHVARWDISLPAPAFWDGIDTLLSHNDAGHPAYLLGQFSLTGWWYFFPVALAVKTPIAFLLLFGVGTYVCWRNRSQPRYRLPAAFALGILLPAMYGNVNIGVRHVLPIYISLSIMAALGLVRMVKWSGTRKWTGPIAALLVLWFAVTGIAAHPDYLSYFNELVPAEREKVMVDSDLDWGQDVNRLARRLRELGATEVSLGSVVHVSDEMLKWSGLPPVKPINPLVPAEGWTVVSPTLDKTTEYGLNHRFPSVEPWYRKLQPKERVGSLHLYYVPPPH
jgi:4-amino-4-deoxy-L-arabinose transferase-like glycosyltransferase